MVQFFERGPSREALQSQVMGRGLGSALGNFLGQQIRRGQLTSALDKVKESATRPGANPIEALTEVMKAGAGIPGSEKYLGQLAPLIMEYVRSNQSGQAGVPTDVEAPEERRIARLQDQYSMLAPRKQDLPQFGQTGPQMQQPMGQELQRETQGAFPSVVKGGEAPGNLPQAATEGIKRPVYTPQELDQMALKRFNQMKRAGLNPTVKEAREEVRQLNEENKLYNAEVEKERKERVAAQEESGLVAEEKLTNLMPDATDEEKAIFRKKGEELRAESKSQADFERKLAAEAKNFKNMEANIKSSLDAPRWWNLKQKLMGKDKTADQAAQDMRTLLKPMLDYGLYDKARRLLEEKGYAPEEREKIINDLDMRSQSVINSTPKVSLYKPSKYKPTGYTKEERKLDYTPRDVDNLKSGIQEIIKNSPNASLVLIRKGFEDKGYDWRVFKDALNDLLQQENGLQLTSDQMNQMQYLNTPPLSTLDKLLEGIGVIGR